MGMLGLAFGGLGAAGRVAWGLAKRPVLGGAVVGGATSYFGSDMQNPQLRLEEAFRGAALGAVGGFAMAKAPGMIWRNKGTIGRGLMGATKIGARAGVAAFEHAGLLAAGVGGAYLASNMLTPKSPTLAGVQMGGNMRPQVTAADDLTGGMGMIGGGAVGPAAQMLGPYQNSLANSTSGLVQGLYRSRHG